MENREDTARSMVKQAGGVYVGIQKALVPHDDLILFNDPVTETTVAVRISIASVSVIKAKLLRSRMMFNSEMKIDFMKLPRKIIVNDIEIKRSEPQSAEVERVELNKLDLHLEVKAIRNQTYLLLAYLRPNSIGLERLHQILARLDVLASYLKKK